mmetsp:Transcript_15262/g.34514  ORF Transcript_15262/g.34514 Transcript_15262/m.34514 type:complete len:219 (+) Transcript_15262:1730-2386(+)
MGTGVLASVGVALQRVGSPGQCRANDAGAHPVESVDDGRLGLQVAAREGNPDGSRHRLAVDGDADQDLAVFEPTLDEFSGPVQGVHENGHPACIDGVGSGLVERNLVLESVPVEGVEGRTGQGPVEFLVVVLFADDAHTQRLVVVVCRGSAIAPQPFRPQRTNNGPVGGLVRFGKHRPGVVGVLEDDLALELLIVAGFSRGLDPSDFFAAPLAGIDAR